MIHLSVAIGRFVEALFYAILRVAGVVTVAVLGIAFAGFLLFMLARWMLARGSAECKRALSSGEVSALRMRRLGS